MRRDVAGKVDRLGNTFGEGIPREIASDQGLDAQTQLSHQSDDISRDGHVPLKILRTEKRLVSRMAEAVPVKSGGGSPPVDWPQDFQGKAEGRRYDKISSGGNSFDIVEPDSRAGEDSWSHMTGGTRKSTEPSKSQRPNESLDSVDNGQQRSSGSQRSQDQPLAQKDLDTKPIGGGERDNSGNLPDNVRQGSQSSKFELHGQKHGMRIGKHFMPEAFRPDSRRNKPSGAARPKQGDRRSDQKQDMASTKQQVLEAKPPFTGPSDGWQKFPTHQKIHQQLREDESEASVGRAGQRKGGSLKDHARLAQLVSQGVWKKVVSKSRGS